MKIIVLFIIILYSCSAKSYDKENWMMLGGIYYDNIFNLNIKLGVAHYFTREAKKNQVTNGDNIKKYNYPSFIYTDYTFSENSDSIGLGWGKLNYATNYRLGVNYTKQKNDTLLGIEGVITLLFYSIKVGIYDSDSDKTKLILGVGLGW